MSRSPKDDPRGVAELVAAALDDGGEDEEARAAVAALHFRGTREVFNPSYSPLGLLRPPIRGRCLAYVLDPGSTCLWARLHPALWACARHRPRLDSLATASR